MNSFNYKNYLQKYPDLKHLSTLPEAWRHYTHFGIAEGRTSENEKMFIELYDRPDRLGANITNYIAQILYAHHKGIGIRLVKDYNYIESPFVMYLFQWIKEYNIIGNEHIEYGNTYDYTGLVGGTTSIIQCDFISYFKKYIKCSFKIYYPISFDISKSILVHLRLGDVSNSPDYNGEVCSMYYKKKVENGEYCNYTQPGGGNKQAPLSTQKIQNIIDKVTINYPDYTVRIVTNPNEIVDFDYPVIQNQDENYDIYLLSKAPIVILSRSTFAISALFFGDHQEVYIPSWGHLVCFGLNTKFDQTNFKYFY